MKIFKPGDRVRVDYTDQNDWVYERFDPNCELNLPHQVYSSSTSTYLWVRDLEIHAFKEESQEPQQTQPKTQQFTQEPTFTLDDLAKACDTSGIGSQKFLELQRALTNLK